MSHQEVQNINDFLILIKQGLDIVHNSYKGHKIILLNFLNAFIININYNKNFIQRINKLMHSTKIKCCIRINIHIYVWSLSSIDHFLAPYYGYFLYFPFLYYHFGALFYFVSTLVIFFIHILILHFITYKYIPIT